MTRRYGVIVGLALLGVLGAERCLAQTNSLFLAAERLKPVIIEQGESWPVAKVPIVYGMSPSENAPFEMASFMAVQLPSPRVFKLHDLVTIIIRETKKYKHDSGLDQKKDVELKAEVGKWPRIHNWELHPQTLAAGKPEIDVSVGGSLKGKGTAQRKDELTTRVTVEVIDIKPNGNLVLQGHKFIKTDDDEEQMILTGTCRSEDIGPDNTILSTQVHDLKIEIKHKGAVRDASRRGWLTRLLSILDPF